MTKIFFTEFFVWLSYSNSFSDSYSDGSNSDVVIVTVVIATEVIVTVEIVTVVIVTVVIVTVVIVTVVIVTVVMVVSDCSDGSNSDTKLKNSNCDKTQKLKLRQNLITQIVTKLKNPNCEKLKIQLLYWQN